VAILVPADSPDPQATYDLLRREAGLYAAGLATKPHVVVITKSDLLPPGAAPPSVRTIDDAPVVLISAVTGAGLPSLLETLWQRLRAPVTTS
jgi:GTP-binding protein